MDEMRTVGEVICCKVDSRIEKSSVSEENGEIFDVLVFRCPVCKMTRTLKIKREAGKGIKTK